MDAPPPEDVRPFLCIAAHAQADSVEVSGNAEKGADILRRWRIHQDRGTGSVAEPEITAETGILGQRFGSRFAEAVRREKRNDGRLPTHRAAAPDGAVPDRSRPGGRNWRCVSRGS